MPRPSYSERSPNYKRLCDIYYNIHTSYLTLLIFPLILIVALHSTKTVFVDVHLQLIFFSSIFFALLDICQALVMSVLSTFDSTHTILNGHAIGFVKGFVVLSFLLCKCFVYAPSFQLLFLYYVGDNNRNSWWLIFIQIFVIIATIVADLAYTFSVEEKYYLNFKKIVFTFYIIFSFVVLAGI